MHIFLHKLQITSLCNYKTFFHEITFAAVNYLYFFFPKKINKLSFFPCNKIFNSYTFSFDMWDNGKKIFFDRPKMLVVSIDNIDRPSLTAFPTILLIASYFVISSKKGGERLGDFEKRFLLHKIQRKKSKQET